MNILDRISGIISASTWTSVGVYYVQNNFESHLRRHIQFFTGNRDWTRDHEQPRCASKLVPWETNRAYSEFKTQYSKSVIDSVIPYSVWMLLYNYTRKIGIMEFMKVDCTGFIVKIGVDQPVLLDIFYIYNLLIPCQT